MDELMRRDRLERHHLGGGGHHPTRRWPQALVVAMLLIAAACGPGGPKVEPKAPQATPFQLRDFHFKSGLHVIGEEDTGAPVVGIVNVVGSGSTSDPAGKEGLAHLVEHLTFRAKHADRTMWSLFQQAGAGMSNAATYPDSTVYYEFGPRDTALDLVSLEANRMLDPLAGIDEQTFAVEREVVRNELRQRGETFVGGAVWAALSKAVYPDAHPYSRPAIGTHQSLDRVTLADAREFVQKRYRPANMTMVVTGDLPLDRLKKLLAEALPAALTEPASDANLAKTRIAIRNNEPPEPPPSKGLVTLEGMVTAPELYLAWSLPPVYGPASHLARIAVGGLQSAIRHAASTDNDVIGGSVELAPGAEASTVIARVLLREGTHPEKSAEFVLNGLVYNWLPDAEGLTLELWFQQRVARIATLMLFESEDITDRGVERAAFAHFTGDLAFMGHRFDAVAALNPSQLESFYVRYLNRDRARSVLVRPLPLERQGTLGRVGIGESKDTSTPAKYELKSLRKLAVSPSLNRLFQARTLKNGLFVEAARHGRTPIVTIGLSVRSGLAEEQEDGAARMAWMLATPGRPLHGEFSDIGALLYDSSDTDGVSFRVRVSSPRLARALPMLADYVSSLEVRSGEFNRFDRYVLSYMRRDQLRPENVGERDFRRALFGSHVFGHMSEIPRDRRPDRDTLNRWIASHVTPARSTLVIVGDIDPEEALRAAEDAFGGWSGAPGDPDPEPLGSAGPPAAVVTHRPGATQAVVRLGCRLPTLDPSQHVAAQIVAVALAQRIGVVRREFGTSYGLSATVEMLRGGTAVMHIGGAIDNAGLSTALRTIRNEMTRLSALKGLEIDRGRWVVASGFNLRLVTSDDWVTRALEAAKNGWALQSIDSVPDAIASVDTSGVLSALRTCTSAGVLSIVGDETIAQRAIKEAWPTTRR